MVQNIKTEIAALRKMSPARLREKYLEVFGESSRSGNKDFLFKRIAWRMQSLAEGSLSERARQRAAELARDADKQDNIRRQTLAQDWTAQMVPGAALADLDEAAMRRARDSFAQKYANRFKTDEVRDWPAQTFLDRAKITQGGQITRTALLLLGKPESAWRLSPHPAQLTWKLVGAERAYEPEFGLSQHREAVDFSGTDIQ